MPEQTIRAVRKVFRFPVLGQLWKFVAALAVYATAVVLLDLYLIDPGVDQVRRDRTGEAIMAGILFGWLMSFRTQSAYARWWDGRSLWGQLVNDSRNLFLKSAAYVPDAAERERLVAAVVRFADVLRDRLRTPKGTPGPHRPMEAAGEVIRIVREWRDAGRIDGFTFLALDQHAQQLMNICGACEKIRTTPLATSYRGLLRKGIAGYMLLLPWLLFREIQWMTVPVTVLVGYAVIGLELIATSIEDPFGYDGDDLPLEEIVATIRRSAKGEM
ncbi:MAG TPA: bestrophin family ion channel [Gemmata sp.]|nr:bestrophin family ion channel [Gemmata sp.]